MRTLTYIENDYGDRYDHSNRHTTLFWFKYAGGGGDLATPTDAAVMITKWKKEGTDAFKYSLFRGNFRKYSAYSVFVFLILLVLDLIVESGSNAFIV